jgi:hypothetical protein
MPGQTGPKTPQGKAKSSQNAVKHGLHTSRMFVLTNETPATWDEMQKAWNEKLQPRDEAERLVVLDIAHAQWRICRARTIETALIDLEMDEQAPTLATTFTRMDEGTRMACALKGLADNSKALDSIHRYETRARRAFNTGLAALERLRSVSPAPAALVEQPKPSPSDGTERQPEPTDREAVTVLPPRPAKRPAAQQPDRENEKLQNEIPCRRRPAHLVPRKALVVQLGKVIQARRRGGCGSGS